MLLLSSDVTVDPQSVGKLADFLLTRPDAGAVGPRVLLPDGRLDPDCRRSFPIPSTMFYRTVGLSKLFPKSPRFGVTTWAICQTPTCTRSMRELAHA